MPYTMTVEGMDGITSVLETAGDSAESIAARSLYIGAGIVADAVNNGARKIRTEKFKYATGGVQRLPSPEEKAVIEDCAAGIAKFDKTGDYVGTAIGYGGAEYANVNFSHMSSKARTNYKAAHVKYHDSNQTSYLRTIGFNTKGYQNQKPVAVIANSINSGTSFMKKQPFIRKAASSSKGRATEAIIAEVTRLAAEMLNRNDGTITASEQNE